MYTVQCHKNSIQLRITSLFAFWLWITNTFWIWTTGSRQQGDHKYFVEASCIYCWRISLKTWNWRDSSARGFSQLMVWSQSLGRTSYLLIDKENGAHAIKDWHVWFYLETIHHPHHSQVWKCASVLAERVSVCLCVHVLARTLSVCLCVSWECVSVLAERVSVCLCVSLLARSLSVCSCVSWECVSVLAERVSVYLCVSLLARSLSVCLCSCVSW